MDHTKLAILEKTGSADVVDLCAEVRCLKQELDASTAGWNQGDPRQAIYKRATIIVLRPASPGLWKTGIGRVDTKEGWYIHVDFGDSLFNYWDPDWWWSFAPNDPLRPKAIG
jgi:hypothetical protein